MNDNPLTLIYFARCSDGLVKIGFTTRWRIRRISLSGLKPKFLFGFSIPYNDGAWAVESTFHKHFEHLRFARTERFRLTDADLYEARNLPLVRVYLWSGKWSNPLCLCHGWRSDWGLHSECITRPALLNRITPKPTLVIPAQVLPLNVSEQ